MFTIQLLSVLSVTMYFHLVFSDPNQCMRGGEASGTKYRCTEVTEDGAVKYVWMCCANAHDVKWGCTHFAPPSSSVADETGKLLGASRSTDIKDAAVSISKGLKGIHFEYHDKWSGCTTKKLCHFSHNYPEFSILEEIQCNHDLHGAQRTAGNILKTRTPKCINPLFIIDGKEIPVDNMYALSRPSEPKKIWVSVEKIDTRKYSEYVGGFEVEDLEENEKYDQAYVDAIKKRIKEEGLWEHDTKLLKEYKGKSLKIIGRFGEVGLNLEGKEISLKDICLYKDNIYVGSGGKIPHKYSGSELRLNGDKVEYTKTPAAKMEYYNNMWMNEEKIAFDEEEAFRDSVIDYRYDVAVERARRKKAIAHLRREQRTIKRLKKAIWSDIKREN